MLHSLKVPWKFLDVCWFVYSGALLAMTLVFLETHVHGNESLIPNFNKAMFQFVVIGHWIVVAVMAVIGLLMLKHFVMRERVPDEERRMARTFH